MANHKSALKRARQNEVKKLRNLGYKTRTKNVVKEVRAAVASNSLDQAKEGLRKATSTIQRAVSKGAIHKNTASRKISRLASRVNGIASS